MGNQRNFRATIVLLLVAPILIAALAVSSFAGSPQLVSYQGILTDGSGLPLSGTFQIAFTIYDAPAAGSAIWTETHAAVSVSDGLFSVLLGSVLQLDDVDFSDTSRYLGITVDADPEIIPRIRLVSVPYAFRTATVDGASGGNIATKVSIGPGHTLSGDSAAIGGGHSNTASGQESTIGGGHSNTASNHDATVGGGFNNTASDLGTTVGGGASNSADGLYSSVTGGQNNHATGSWSFVGGGGDNTAGNNYAAVAGGTNNTVSDSYSNIAGGIQNSVSSKYSAILGGFGDTIQAAADYSYLFGIKSVLTQDSTFMVDMPHIRFGDEATGFEFPPVDGTSGQVMSTDGSGQLSWVAPGGGGGGGANGWVDDGTVVRLDNGNDSLGIGTATPDAPVHILKTSNSGTPTFGFHNEFSNTGTGGGIATRIEYKHGNNSGISAGMTVSSTANTSDTAYGIGATASNDGAGPAKGGFFVSAGSGTGHKYGIEALAENNANSDARGVYGIASNSGAGLAAGGYFHARTGGTGSKVGVIAVADANTTQLSTGVYALARNDGTGGTLGGYFEAATGPGINKSVEVNAQTTSSSDVYGYDGNVVAFGGGTAYGASLDVTTSTGSNIAYGVKTLVTHQGSGASYGVNSDVTNYGASFSVGGFFNVNDAGTGVKLGVLGIAEGTHSNRVLGIEGGASNNGSGNAFGIYGHASSVGTGTHYGVYGSEASGGGGAALYAAGDLVVSGSKSAVVRTSQGEKLMYAVEATEVWFEHIGDAQLSNGTTHVELDPLFLETVEIDINNPMRVFVQLNGDCNGTYVKVDQTGFDVYELQSGSSNVTFTYRVMAKRKGYADERIRETDAGKWDVNLYPERRAEIEAYWNQQDDPIKPRVPSID